MNARRVLAVAWKEGREIWRDRLYFGLAFTLPVILMIVYCYGLVQDVENAPFAILDQDRSTLSRDYARRFLESRYFDFKGHVADAREAERLLVDARVRMVLVVPPGFERDLREGRGVSVQTIFDGTNTTPIRTLRGYVASIHAAMGAELRADRLARTRGLPPERAEVLLQPVRVETRYLYNREVRALWAIAPSMIMFILMMTSPLLTALSIVREKETGAIYNIYSATITRAEYLLGKLLPNAVVSFLNILVLFVLATQWFGAPFEGSFGLFAAASLGFVLCTGCLGLLVSLLAKSQQAALMISVICGVVVALNFSGMTTPPQAMPPSLYATAQLFPAMSFRNVVLGTFLKGLDMRLLWRDAAYFALYAALAFALCAALFRKRTKA
ncbi:MAG: ABC transporter permease [Planctomycetes bacterium]|nr:ABC transporter permease [Planctomycetota bacterium]